MSDTMNIAQLEMFYQDARTLHERTDKIEYFGLVGVFGVWSYLAANGMFRTAFLTSAAISTIVLFRVTTLNFYLKQTNAAIRLVENDNTIVDTRSSETTPFVYRNNRQITWFILILISVIGVCLSKNLDVLDLKLVHELPSSED